VPAYNHQKYVVDCLNSIKDSDYANLELIVSDDVSSDETFHLADCWIRNNASRFARALSVRQPTNLGIVRNLQFLFDQAEGEYLVYIASDDRLMASSITERVAILKRDKSIDALFGNAQLISSEGTVMRERFIPDNIARQLSSRRLILSSLVLHANIPGPVMMLRREAVLEGGSLGRLPEQLAGEDAYIHVRLGARHKIAFVNSPVAQWRFVEGSLSTGTHRQTFTRGYTLASDRLNRTLLRGFDRLAIEIRIGSHDNAQNRPAFPIYFAKRVFFRLATMILRFILSIRPR
jgi:glycosyltransferase involved in cell wall biosynthesis